MQDAKGEPRTFFRLPQRIGTADHAKTPLLLAKNSTAAVSSDSILSSSASNVASRSFPSLSQSSREKFGLYNCSISLRLIRLELSTVGVNARLIPNSLNSISRP